VSARLGLGEAVGDELEVFLQVLAWPGFGDELDEPLRGIVGEPGEFGDGDDAVRVGGEDTVLARVEAFVAALGIGQPRLSKLYRPIMQPTQKEIRRCMSCSRSGRYSVI